MQTCERLILHLVIIARLKLYLILRTGVTRNVGFMEYFTVHIKCVYSHICALRAFKWKLISQMFAYIRNIPDHLKAHPGDDSGTHSI